MTIFKNTDEIQLLYAFQHAYDLHLLLKRKKRFSLYTISVT